MPYFSIPVKSLNYLGFFGFQTLEENDDFCIMQDREGRKQIISKTYPRIYFDGDDVNDAIQLGTTGIVQLP
jgi:hypothetical protein